jgi:hypothetical protein
VVHDDTAPSNDRCADDRRLDAAGWVLGSLDPDDAGRFVEHLLACLECRLTVAGLEPTARVLLMPALSWVPPRLQAATLRRVRAAARRVR